MPTLSFNPAAGSAEIAGQDVGKKINNHSIVIQRELIAKRLLDCRKCTDFYCSSSQNKALPFTIQAVKDVWLLLSVLQHSGITCVGCQQLALTDLVAVLMGHKKCLTKKESKK